MPILVILRLEESITQRNRFNPLHIRIHNKLRVNVKENRHIHCLASIQPLLLETKALNLAKVRCHLARRHTVGCDADNVFAGLVGRSVEGERGFARQDANFALLRCEFPWQHVGHGAVEGYA
jgi:hypothetical protein